MPNLHRAPLGPSPPDPDDDAPLRGPDRSLGLRVLALVGSFSLLIMGLSSIVVPLLMKPPVPELPDRRQQEERAGRAVLEHGRVQG